MSNPLPPIDPHYVYIIAHIDADGNYDAPIKIGISRNVRSRVKGLSTASPRKIEIFFAFGVPAKEYARDLEREFHARFAEKRMNGEWFDVSPILALVEMTGVMVRFFTKHIGNRPDLMKIAYEKSGWKEAEDLIEEVEGLLLAELSASGVSQ